MKTNPDKKYSNQILLEEISITLTFYLGNTNGTDLLLVGCQQTQDRVPVTTSKTISPILAFVPS